METIQTVNLINNISLVSAGSTMVDLVIGSDFDGNPVGTILSDGMPVIVLILNYPDSQGDWSWVEGLRHPDIFARQWRQAVISLGLSIGEVSEAQDARWSDDVGGSNEVDTWLDIMSDPAAEGHELLALVDRCIEVMRARFA